MVEITPRNTPYINQLINGLRMFTPAIYITHKTLRQIVDIEIANYQLQKELKHFIPKYQKRFLTGLLSTSQRKFSQTIHTDKALEDFVNGKKELDDLRPIRNAVQAVDAHETSLRAEDDWDLLNRINQQLNRESLAVQGTNLRTGKKSTSKVIIDLHTFENNDQLQHFTLELLRWYRTSDKEINKILRILTVLYHLIKTAPFQQSNLETILITYTFFLRENELELLNTINIPQYLLTITDQNLELNDFINQSLELIVSEKNKLFYELEKQSLEHQAPKKILNLNRRQIELLKVMQARDKINRRDAADLLEVSFMTAYRDIKGLLKNKLLVEKGVGRGTYYVLASR